jgi:hypothetical protein
VSETKAQEGEGGLHPAIADLLSFFKYDHLPEDLQKVSAPCADLAYRMTSFLDGPEATVGLRKLLEAKDCFVRARLASTEDRRG